MSDYDQYVTKPAATAKPSAGANEYAQYVRNSAPQPQISAPFGGSNFFNPTKLVQGTGKNAAKTVGRAIVAGHKDPVGAMLSATQAPQRGLEALETGADPVKAFTDPKQGPALSRAVKQKIGLQGLENGPLAGSDLPHKIMRGVADTALDTVNDPVSFIPGLDLAKIPGVKQAGAALAKTALGKGASHLLSPDDYLRGLTPEAKAKYEVATNKAMEAVRQHKVADDKIVKAHAAEIRKGIMPPEVAALFRPEKGQAQDTAWQAYLTDPETGKLKFGPGTKPQDVSKALFQSRAPEFKAAAMPELQAGGFFTTPSGLDAGRSMGKPDLFTVPKEEIPEVQKRLARNVETKLQPQNELVKGARTLTHLGNKAFLANPIPHTFNLSNLAYNRYGAPTVAKGLGNAARVATSTTGSGHLAKNIQELEQLGAKSQYGNIFDEMGLTRLAGIPGTEPLAGGLNKALIPLQRASNAAQHNILNSTETGLRAAALDAERKGGVTGPQAAKNIHATFGTDAPNAISDAGSGLGAPFFKFHAQTAPGSVLRTLSRNPARITNAVKANRDMNQQVNPSGAKYHSTVPGANSARMLADPLGYFASLGPISELQSPYGLKAELLKGPSGVAKIAGDAAARFTPGSQEAQAIAEMLSKKKGRAKESGQQDLITSLLGGYFGK